MKKGFFLFLVLSILFVIRSYGQNWVIYDTANSPTPYIGYSHIQIDTANHKWLAKAFGAGGRTVFFDNDTTWTERDNVFMGLAFTCWAFKVDKKNVVWEATTNDKVYSLTNGINGYWQYYDGDSVGVPAMNRIYDIAVDHNNVKWFASHELIKYNDTTFTQLDTASHTLPFEPVSCLAVDKNNNLWIAGGTHGIAKYDGVNWQVFTAPFYSQRVHRMQIDSNLNVFFGFGSWADGLYKFDGTSTWTSYTTTNSGISTDKIFTVNVDQHNTLWVGGATGGASSFDGTNWTVYNTSNSPMPYNIITAIEVDKFNNKWISTGNGVVVFNETGVVGVNEINRQMAALNLYPNPGKDAVTMSIETENSENVTLTILNSLGQSVKAAETRSVQKGKT
ncbi:MAG: hypothetical protein JWP12_1212, partial [Bacteroidetes bacterium]|nr:hypothetical protein [Bacteroidota bacterium]